MKEICKEELSKFVPTPDIDDFDLVIGVPPVTQRVDDVTRTLNEVPINDGEVLRIQRVELANTVLQAAPRPARRTTSSSKGEGVRVDKSTSSFGRSAATLNGSSGMRSSQSKKERAPRRPKATAGNEEDIADHLLSAVTGEVQGVIGYCVKSFVVRLKISTKAAKPLLVRLV